MTSYTLQGSQTGPAAPFADAGAVTLGLQVSVSEAVPLTAVLFWSPPGAPVVPTSAAVYDTSTGQMIAGSQTAWPAGGAGTGWISCPVTGITLQPGTDYTIAVFSAGGSDWFGVTSGYWTTGPGAGGLASGPLSAPDNAAAIIGQSSYDTSGSIAFPSSSFGGTNVWVDAQVELTPAAAVSASWPFDAVTELVMGICP